MSNILSYFSPSKKPYKVVFSGAGVSDDSGSYNFNNLAGTFKRKEKSFSTQEELADYLQQFEPSKSINLPTGTFGLGSFDYFPVITEKKDNNTVVVGLSLTPKYENADYFINYK